MIILGIETSCDETAVAVVKNGNEVLSNVIASQIDIHAETGGVVPEVAAREHVLQIVPVIDKALRDARDYLRLEENSVSQINNLDFSEIDAVAITKGPGLVSSLLIGTTAGSAFALAAGKPVIEVNHVEAHMMANWLERDSEEIRFPILILTVSGGHNELIVMKDFGEYEVIGETLDDAAGEAFDKVARLLGLGYPGGPIVSKIAESGDADRFKLPVVVLEKDSLDFSFSGLKTAVLSLIKKAEENGEKRDDKFVADVAACFQKTVVEIFVEKVRRAMDKYPYIKEVHLTGGVSANTQLRAGLKFFFEKERKDVIFRYPKKLSYCTDNAAMIACCGYFQWKKNPEKFKKWKNCVGDPRFS